MNTHVRVVLGVIIGLIIGVSASSVFYVKNEGQINEKYTAMYTQAFAGAARQASMSAQNSMTASSLNAANSAFNGMSGDSFDKSFISQMVMQDQQEIQLAQSALKNATRQEIKDAAQTTISEKQSEIEQLNQWGREWYGDTASSSAR